MRSFSAILLVGVVMLVGVFGVFFMIHAEGESHAECPLGTVESNSCESITSPLASIAFHMKGLLQPAVASALAGILAFAALLVLALTMTFLPETGTPTFPLALTLALASLTGHASLRKARAWLIVLEKRDPSFAVAMSA